MMELAALGAGWLRPMFDEPASTDAWQALILAASALVWLVGLYGVHRSMDAGPVLRAEARWRYRSRAIRERIGRARSWFVLADRTWGWWVTRLEFAAALAAIAAWGLIARAMQEPMFGADIPPVSLVAVSLLGMLVGLAWMIRIYRAPLSVDMRAYWRYRDRA